jgi:hypothetical protein
MPSLAAKRRPNPWTSTVADVDAWQKTIPLPQDEQKTRGMEILQMIQEQVHPSDSCGSVEKVCAEESDDVDVKVIVKHTFIEVVDPRLKRMTRSMSDSGLALDSFLEKQWICESPLKKMSSDCLQDFSDASTDDLDACSREFSVREDNQMSDDDTAMENLMPTCDSYPYAESWWTSAAQEGHNLGAALCKKPPQLNAEAEPFVPMQWLQSPMGSIETPSGEHMHWSDRVVNQETVSREYATGEWPSSGRGARWPAAVNMVSCDGTALNEKPDSGEWRTTVMLRNMPNNYTRDMLIELVDEMGFGGTYDFAYLPIDFSSQAGLGYAFINFVSPEKAQLCFDVFEGFSQWKVPSEKVCTVTWSSPYQGLESHIERYRNSPVMHHSIIDEWKPVLFRNGRRVPFPSPTKTIKNPKIRQQPSPPSGVQLQ